MFNKVLVGYDGSSSSRAAIQQAYAESNSDVVGEEALGRSAAH